MPMRADDAALADATGLGRVRIPKIFHVVWIGDETREPRAAIASWAERHPDFDLRVYRNAEADAGPWRFKADIDEFRRRGRYPGAADLMRWEVLLRDGGVALDADSVCLARLPDWLLDCGMAACWDNTFAEGEMLSNGVVLATPNNPTVAAILDEIGSKPIKYDKWSWSRMGPKPYGEWQTTGPGPLTRAVKQRRPTDFTALPSHFFIPSRRDGERYSGGAPVIADQLWASTQGKGRETDALTQERLAAWGANQNAERG